MMTGRLPEPSWIGGPPEYDEPVQPRCGHCGAFLPFEVERTEYQEHSEHCDGTVTFHDEPYSDEVVAILGDEFAGKTYKVAVSACGLDKALHEPHDEILHVAQLDHRTCRRCGHDAIGVS